MKKICILAGAVLFIFCAVSAARADDQNGGFEIGDFTGWTVSEPGYSQVRSTPTYYAPVEGNYFAQLSTHAVSSEPIPLPPGPAITLTQYFNIASGEMLTGYAAFDAGDYMPFNDYAYAKISGANDYIWYRNVAGVKDYGYTEWEAWNWTPSVPGRYLLELGVGNGGDDDMSSLAMFDGVTTKPVPEPISSALFLLGAGALGLKIRRKNGGVK